LIDVLLDMFLF